MSDSMRVVAPWRMELQKSRLLVLFELALVAAVFVADEYGWIYFSKTPYLLALGWISMYVRGVSWRDVGLHRERGFMRMILIGLAAGLLFEGLELFVTQPVFVAITGKYPDLSDFTEVIGNVKLLLILVLLSWVVAGFGEEMVWRGYLLNRITDLLGRSKAGWAGSLIIMSAAFGLAHSYQDVTGIAENMLDGLLYGLLYLACGRQLIVLIVAHGFTDTIDFLIIYSGHYPGMR